MPNKIELIIQDNSNGNIYDVSDLIEGTITWNTDRLGGAGKLEFNILPNGSMAFYEGSRVYFKYNNQNVFYGFIFSKSRNKEKVIKVIAYDQLRYLKNKETYIFENKKASDILKQICKDWQLKTGNIEDTKYVIPSMIEDDKTLLDIIFKANDLTLVSSKKLYVLSDNFGQIDLRNVENLKTDLIVDGSSNLIDFDYSSSIDENTANQVKLVKKDKNGKRNVYMLYDSKNIDRWGKLQLFESVDENMNEAQIIERATQSLSLYNRVFRKLSIPVIGDLRAKAGNSIFVQNLNVGDMIINECLLIEQAKHSFSNNDYQMQLELRIV